MTKVLFTTNLPSPYRVDFFNELSKYVDLTVFFFWEKGEDNRPWNFSPHNYRFKYKILKEVKVKKFRYNPSLFNEFKKEEFDFIIIGGYSLISEMLLIYFCSKNKLLFAINSDGGFVNYRNFIIEAIKHKLISSGNYWLSSGKKCTETLLHYGAIEENICEYKFSSMRKDDILKAPQAKVQKESQKKALSINPNTKVVLTVGQYIHRKGIDIVIECAEKLHDRNYTFITIGQGPLNEEYQKNIQVKGLSNIMMLDYMDRKELKEYLKAADLFLLPTREDVWGLVINEAIAFGIPVIASEHAGAAHELIDGNGFMTSLNVDEITHRICEVLENDELAYSFSQVSLKIAECYNIEEMVRVHQELIFAATGKR